MKQCSNSSIPSFTPQNYEINKNSSTGNLTFCIPETRSLKKVQNCLETSFEKDANYQHPQVIWQASINFLQKSYLGQFQTDSGLNGDNIYAQIIEFDEEQFDLEEIIHRNKILTETEKQQILVDLKLESGFHSLLESLSKLFKEYIFQQILFVCCWSWGKYVKYKNSNRIPLSLQNINLQTILDFELENLPSLSDPYLSMSEEEIIKEADKAAEEISSLVYLNHQIKYINLMEAEGRKRKQIRQEFTKFIQSITRGVFLCVEGFFMHPTNEAEERQFCSYGSFGSFSQEDQSELECFGWRERKYRKQL